MLKICTVLLVLFTLTARGQGSLKHYERNWRTDTLHLPCDKFNTKDFAIVFPDSIFNAGVVRIKKMVLNKKSKVPYKLIFEDNTITRVEIGPVKKDKDVAFYQSYYNTILLNDSAVCPLKISTEMRGSKQIIVVTQK